MKIEFRKEDLLKLLKIRSFEQKLLKLFSQGLINGTTHTAVGQEDIPLFISRYIDIKKDKVFSNHRCHAHYLSLTEDYHGLLAEIMGRRGGVCGGLGGSQHLCNSFFYSSGILASALPVAAGIAESMQINENYGKVLLYMGEGTFGQGLVYEVFNYVSLRRLPIIFIVEDNSYSQSTPKQISMSGNIVDRTKAFDLDYFLFDETSFFERMELIEKFFENWQRNPLPTLLHFKTNRLNAHSKGDDSRSKDEITAAWNKDFIPELQRYFGLEIFNEQLYEAKKYLDEKIQVVLDLDYEDSIFYLN